MQFSARSLLTVAAAVSFTAVALAGEEPGTAEGQGVTVSADDDDDEPGWFGKYFPWSVNDDLDESVDDIVVPTYLINILPIGGFWGPLLFLDDRPDMSGDVALAYFIPFAAGAAIWVGANIVGWGSAMVCPPMGLISCIGLVGCVPMCWNAPTASLNAWDHAYKHPEEAEQKKKRRKRSPSKKKESGGGGKGGDGYEY